MLLGLERNENRKNAQLILTVIASAFLLGLAFYVPHLAWWVFFALLPLFFILESKRSIFLPALLFWWIVWACGFYSFFWDAFPLVWAPEESHLSIFLIILIGWLSTTGTAALIISSGMLFIQKTLKNDNFNILFIPSALVLSEYLATIAIDLLIWAPGNSVTGHLSISLIGNILADSEILRQYSSIGGVYALSFVVFLFSICLFRIFKNHYFILNTSVIVVVILFPLIIKGYDSPTSSLTIGLINMNMPTLVDLDEVEYKKRATLLNEAISDLSSSNMDLIVLPEGVYNTLSSSSQQTPLLSSLQTMQEKIVRTAIVQTPSIDIRVWEKQFLVPIGEYMPWLVSIFGTKPVHQLRDNMPSYTKTGLKINNTPITTAFCSEIFSPTIYQKQVLGGSKLIINQASHARYNHTPRLALQTLRAGQIQATSLNRELILVNNSNYGFHLDHQGNLLRLLPANKPASSYTIKATGYDKKTIFSYLGQLILLLPAIFILFILLIRVSQNFVVRGNNSR